VTYPDTDDVQRRGRAARTAVKGGGRSGGEGLGRRRTVRDHDIKYTFDKS
jgi:hypothetical protein